jgi:hypothetical protein
MISGILIGFIIGHFGGDKIIETFKSIGTNLQSNKKALNKGNSFS